MRTNIGIAALLYPMVQAIAFGFALIGLLGFNAPSSAYPLAIAATFLVSVPIALVLAPRLRSRIWRRRQALSSTQ